MQVTLKTKFILAATLTMSCIITPALATVGNIAQIENKPIVSQSLTAEPEASQVVITQDNTESDNSELAYAFDNSETVQVQAMSKKEMQETQGAFWGIVVKIIITILASSVLTGDTPKK